MSNVIQQEFDMFEKYIIDKFLGGEVRLSDLAMFADTIEEHFGIKIAFDLEDVQKIVDGFEAFMKPLMKENGELDVKAFKRITGHMFPKFKEYLFLLPDENFRLIDFIRNFNLAELIAYRVNKVKQLLGV